MYHTVYDAPEVGIKSQQYGFPLLLWCLSFSSGDNNIKLTYIWTLEDTFMHMKIEKHRKITYLLITVYRKYLFVAQ